MEDCCHCCCQPIVKRPGVTKERTPKYGNPLPHLTFGLSLFASLIVVRMLVAPLPIVPLIPGTLLVVSTISSMVLHQVAPVRMIFTIIPVMVVVMMGIVYSYLYAFLGSGAATTDGHKYDSR
jgi:hypothetical protein